MLVQYFNDVHIIAGNGPELRVSRRDLVSAADTLTFFVYKVFFGIRR